MSATIVIDFPRFDAHFWVERNGEIIDFYFPEYDFIKRVNGCVGEPIYLPAPQETQTLVIEIMKKKLQKIVKTDNYEQALQRFYKLYSKSNMLKPICYCCIQNAFIEIQQNGGNLVFGSYGWKRKNGTIHYEFGGEDWKTWSDFKK